MKKIIMTMVLCVLAVMSLTAGTLGEYKTTGYLMNSDHEMVKIPTDQNFTLYVLKSGEEFKAIYSYPSGNFAYRTMEIDGNWNFTVSTGEYRSLTEVNGDYLLITEVNGELITFELVLVKAFN